MRKRATPPLLPPSCIISRAACPRPCPQAPGDSRTPCLCPELWPASSGCLGRFGSLKAARVHSPGQASTCWCLPRVRAVGAMGAQSSGALARARRDPRLWGLRGRCQGTPRPRVSTTDPRPGPCMAIWGQLEPGARFLAGPQRLPWSPGLRGQRSLLECADPRALGLCSGSVESERERQ